MDYVECFVCELNPLIGWALMIAVAIIAFLAVRGRQWTFAAALSGIPLALWYLDGPTAALIPCGALLVGRRLGRLSVPFSWQANLIQTGGLTSGWS